MDRSSKQSFTSIKVHKGGISKLSFRESMNVSVPLG